MKKIKLMLTTIAILAVVGGTFALKAKKAFEVNVWYTTVTTTFLGKTCPLAALTTAPGNLVFATSYYYSITQSGACVPPKIYFTTPD